MATEGLATVASLRAAYPQVNPHRSATVARLSGRHIVCQREDMPLTDGGGWEIMMYQDCAQWSGG